jgi:hypothetical protein
MRELYYTKRGRRYYPAAVDAFYDSYPQGAHLVIVDDGWKMTQLSINPDKAALLAIKRLAHKQIVQIVQDGTSAEIEMHKSRCKSDKKYREKCEKAWAAYREIMGEDDPIVLCRAAASDMAENIVDKLLELANG